MIDIKLLKNQRREKLDEGQALINKTITEERELTDEEHEQYEKSQADFKMYDEQVRHFEELDEQRNATLDPEIPIQTVNQEPENRQEPENKWQNFGEFLHAVYRAGIPGQKVDPRLIEERATGLSEGVPSEGGFFVHKDFVAEILRRTYELGVLSSRVRRYPIGANSNGLKINTIDETSRATGSRLGGVRVYWAAEAGVKTESKPKFGQLDLELKKAIGLYYSTDELLQDAVAMSPIIMDAFSEEFAFVVDDAIYQGTGAGMPLGIMNSPALVTVAKEAGQPAATILAENVIKMRARLWGKARKNSVWLINQDIEPQLFTMSLAVGTGGVPVYMPANGLSQSPYDTLFGRPVIPVEYAATLGTKGDIMLVDLNQYLMIDKGGIQAASSIHVKFVYDETAFRFVYRVDGEPMWSAPLTPYKGAANTQSPYVVLATRA